MIKIFDTLEKYNTYTNNGQNLESGDLYYVKEDNSTHYLTNNIDGVTTIYDTVENPTGNIEITANGTNIDVAPYSTATVDVPIPEGYIIPTGNKSITANGENIDVNDYATASVNVPVPPEYIIPTGNVSLTENGENINIAQYATATVNVAQSGFIESVDNYTGTSLELNKMIKSIDIPNSVTSIGVAAFRNCYNLTSVTIGSGVTSIGDNAFSGCTGLTIITLPNTITSIGDSAFNNCTSLPVENYIRYADTCAVEATDKNQTSYTLKEGTKYINSGIFTNNSKLQSITLPSSVIFIGGAAFRNCYNLTSIAIPSSVTTISSSAFNSCSGLTSITIPSGVTKIETQSFYSCSGLTSITIPSGVTIISGSAFAYCSSLTSITVEATTPPTLGFNALESTNNCPIYVPAESVDTYKAASGWSTYASRIQAL